MSKKFFYGVIATLVISATMQAKIVHITNEDQYNEALKSNKQLIVEFSADWCSVCNNVRAPYEQIANEKEFSQVAFCQVDVDKLDGVSKQNGIVGVPTFVYVENGAKKVEEIGVQNMPAFKDHLRDNLRKTFQLAQNDIDMSMSGNQPDVVTDEVMAIDVTAPAPEAQPEPNFFMKIVLAVKNFVMLILSKVQEFFSTIVDALKGFFSK